MIWAALLIPLIAIIFVAIKHPQKMNVFEYVLLFVIPTACICLCKVGSIYTQTRDTEYWNSYAVSALYEEEWKEQWRERHTETTTDSKGNSHTRTYWTTESKRHPEKWTVLDNIGESHSITREHFEKLCKTWSNRNFKEMDRKHTSRHRNESSHKILKDGDAYVTDYDKNVDNLEFICSQHTYENKVQCSRSVFNFEDVSPETKTQYSLFDYPKENIFDFNPILGYSNKEASRLLNVFNALNGSSKQLHMMLLVFTDQPLETALFQESYWKGGNKNEFLVCVGINSTNITWTKVISWTEQETLKVRITREIKEMKTFDAVKIVKYMGENIPNGFVRKEFEEFSYLSVEPPMILVIITYLITLALTIVIVVISVNNRHDFGTFINR